MWAAEGTATLADGTVAPSGSPEWMAECRERHAFAQQLRGSRGAARKAILERLAFRRSRAVAERADIAETAHYLVTVDVTRASRVALAQAIEVERGAEFMARVRDYARMMRTVWEGDRGR